MCVIPSLGHSPHPLAAVKENGRPHERHADDVSIGASKFYRVSCFKAIGGFVREVMWDGIDCHRCRMNGWIACSWDEPELRFIHLRPEGASQKKGTFARRMRHGYGQYFMGTGFLFIVASSIYRLNRKPYVLGSLAMIWRWLKTAFEGKPRYEDAAFRKFLRRYQWRALWVGKTRALEQIYRQKEKM
jgi:poly-beta-1,6-N-acetyl-D-glucosamine synthase